MNFLVILVMLKNEFLGDFNDVKE